jgi:hypothetical protein
VHLEVPYQVEAGRDARWGASYRLVYGLRGAPGACAVQQVRARVRYLLGDDVLVEYETCYGEWFRLGNAGELPTDLHDVHDFCVHRDAWTPKRLRDLLRKQGLLQGRWLPAGGEPRVECHKEFLLGLGEVEDSPGLVDGSGGAAFGFLEDGPLLHASSTIDLRLGEGKQLEPPSPYPFGRSAGGRGRFTGEQGWRAEERYCYRFATTSGRLQGEGYQPAPLTSSFARSSSDARPRSGSLRS